MSLSIGDVIDDKYRIIRVIGEGGMGMVYEGENTRIHRRVAIKLLRAGFSSSSDAVQRFEREAQAAGRIGSQHIVEVLDLGELDNGDRYMVMEFLEGEPLSTRIQNMGKLMPETTTALAVQLLEGLKAAHNAGIVHRDLKPDNIFLLSDKRGRVDFVKIVDFGISKFSTLGGEFSMTRTGAVMGTPYYLSPEQAKGERHVDHRSDLYAVGVIMWEACAGRVPFDAETFNELLFKIVLEPTPPLVRVVAGIEPEFSAIVQKAMARDPQDRFQSAHDMQQALVNWFEKHASGPILPTSLPKFTNPVDSLRANIALSRTPQTGQRTLTPQHSQTSGNWENEPERKQTGITKKVVVAALAVAVALVGAAVLIFQFSGEEGADPGMVPVSAVPPAEAARPVKSVAPEVNEAPEVEPIADPPASAPDPPAASERSAPSQVANREEESALSASATRKWTQKAPAAAPLPAQPQPAPAAAPPPANDGASATPKGRKIRTKL